MRPCTVCGRYDACRCFEPKPSKTPPTAILTPTQNEPTEAQLVNKLETDIYDLSKQRNDLLIERDKQDKLIKEMQEALSEQRVKYLQLASELETLRNAHAFKCPTCSANHPAYCTCNVKDAEEGGAFVDFDLAKANAAMMNNQTTVPIEMTATVTLGSINPVKNTDNGAGSPEFLRLLDDMREVHLKKAHDYGIGKDPLANCRGSERFGVPGWVGTMIRAMDKVTRIQAFIEKGELKNESVDDSLIDLANYALIALVLLRETRNAGTTNT